MTDNISTLRQMNDLMNQNTTKTYQSYSFEEIIVDYLILCSQLTIPMDKQVYATTKLILGNIFNDKAFYTQQEYNSLAKQYDSYQEKLQEEILLDNDFELYQQLSISSLNNRDSAYQKIQATKQTASSCYNQAINIFKQIDDKADYLIELEKLIDFENIHNSKDLRELTRLIINQTNNNQIQRISLKNTHKRFSHQLETSNKILTRSRSLQTITNEQDNFFTKKIIDQNLSSESISFRQI